MKDEVVVTTLIVAGFLLIVYLNYQNDQLRTEVIKLTEENRYLISEFIGVEQDREELQRLVKLLESRCPN